MTNGYLDAGVLCPFYKSERSDDLYCEGIDWHSTTITAFSAGKYKTEYKNSYCCDKWQKCGLAMALERKYD